MKKLSIDEIIICGEIAKKAISLGIYTEEEKLTTLIDITASAAFWEMDIEKWLNANDKDFMSDMANIKNHIQREEPISFYNGIKLKFATVK